MKHQILNYFLAQIAEKKFLSMQKCAHNVEMIYVQIMS